MPPRKRPTRVAVESVLPSVDDGRVPAHRVPGDWVEVSADVFADGSAAVRASVRVTGAAAGTVAHYPMEPLGNDRWRGRFAVGAPGEYHYEVEGWVDPYLTWRRLLDRRVGAGSVSPLELREGAEILRAAGRRIRGPEGARLADCASELDPPAGGSTDAAIRLARDEGIDGILAANPDRREIARSPICYPLRVDPPEAQHSAWYELFPRSTSPEPGRTGTFRDVRARLPYVAELGFDVVYLPPIHPIGQTGRRGPNNEFPAPPEAPGSPWAIGSAEGGHTSIHPALGDLEEFRRTVEAARTLGLAVALDLAFQCSPDHPWVREHPEWFHHLPDGTIRPAENPPKRYDDIYSIDFGTSDWPALWTALREAVEFWIAQGVRWFRVDNPHTKPFEFWRWLLGEVRRAHPEVMFLAEAFTRPKVMYRLAKVGFTHSYTYFAWRTGGAEISEYFREIAGGAVAEYFRPHLWPNTPDILTEQFHAGERSVFVHRLVLAATLSSHYGIYGPAYERLDHVPLRPGSEEYRDSEKFSIRSLSPEPKESLAPEIRRLNRIRRAHPALRAGRRLTFHPIDNASLLVYSRRTEDRSDVILVVVNLDPRAVQSGWTALDLTELGIGTEEPFDVNDLLADRSYRWRGPRNYLRLDPAVLPAHVFHVVRAPDPPPAGR
ncbi:MAG: alpha-1,4-glucan--maltose-1-phosphate maltosyltransferase [Thermoplasmata archaeon]